MGKIFLIILIVGMLAVSSSALAKTNGDSFWASILMFVQNLLPGEEPMPVVEEPEDMEEFVDPREVQQVLREIKDMKRELNRISKQLKKMPNSADDLNQVSALLGEIQNYENSIKSGTNLRETIQDFRDAQIWEQIQRFRAKIEIPKEIKQWNKEFKRLEKILKQKSFQKLGLDIEKVKVKLQVMKDSLAKVEQYYNSGDLENAIEELDELRQDVNPGEIMSVFQQVREVTDRMRRIKDEEIRGQIEQILQEVRDNFNEGEYRIARELMDENRGEILKIISASFKKGSEKQNLMEMFEKLEEKMKEKAEEKKVTPTTPPAPEIPKTPPTTETPSQVLPQPPQTQPTVPLPVTTVPPIE